MKGITMNEKRNAKLRDALLKALAVAAFTAIPATALAPVASAQVFLDDVNDDYTSPSCDLGGDGRGDGSVSDPYKISTVEDLAEIGDCDYNDSGLYYVLTNDIDASTNGNYNNDGTDWNTANSGWVPIGDYHDNNFQGNFDGKGHTISNLDIWNNTDSQGLFQSAWYATIKNLNIEVEVDANGYSNIGALVGNDYASSITNVHAVVDIYDNDDNTGGLVGESYGTRITNSSTSGSIVAQDDDYSDNTGGLVGYASNGSDGVATKLAHVSSSVDINDLAANHSGDIEYEEVGGIVGNGDSVIISDATFSGTAMGNNDLGGIVGYFNEGSVTDSVVTDGAAIGTAEDYYASNIGGIVGDADGGISITNVTFNGDLQLDKASTSYESDYIGGIVGYLDYSTVAGATVSSKATLAARGNGDGSNDFGGIVGYAYASNVSTSVNNATVNAADVWAVGGLVGESDNSSIDKSVNRGFVHATDDDSSFGSGNVGGLVGFLDYRSVVSDSTNKGNVTLDGSEDAWNVGGIAGEQDWAQIIDSYNTGNITGVYSVAGITGLVTDEGATIENTYSVGKLVAWNDNIDAIANLDSEAYFDGTTNAAIISATGQTNYTDALLLTAAQVKAGTELARAGWSINEDGSTWKTSVDFNRGFPYLAWETVSSDVAPEVGLLDQNWTGAVVYAGGKRFRLNVDEKNILNSIVRTIKDNPFASVDLDVYYGKKAKLAGKRAANVKRWLVYRGVAQNISVHIMQADDLHVAGQVDITAYAN